MWRKRRTPSSAPAASGASDYTVQILTALDSHSDAGMWGELKGRSQTDRGDTNTAPVT